jgi:MFS family permease
MASSSAESVPLKRSLWLAIIVGWLAQLALASLLPLIAQVVGRLWAGEAGDSWAEHTRSTSEFGWFVIQGAVFFASVLAGVLAGYLAPRRPVVVAVVLVLLSLAVTFFEQLPSPRTLTLTLFWVLLPCAGLVVGVALSWKARQHAV